MKSFQIFRYLKKWMPFIVLFFVGMTLLANRMLSSRQEYVAKTVIRYNNDEAVDGLAPDGSEIDVTEINSADNMTKVVENLGSSARGYSADELAASITVTPIVKEEEEAIQLALNEQGERYTEQPTEYQLTCTMGSDVDEDFVRNLLNEVLDVYLAEYSNEHVNGAQIDNNVKGFRVDHYDYLEAIEKLGDELADTIDELGKYVKSNSGFRSVRTGYSFSDIQQQFILLRDVNLYRIYSLILGNRITRDPDLLVARYLDRIANYSLSGGRASDEIADNNRIVKTYLQKMRYSGNSNVESDYILPNVYNEREKDSSSGGTSSGSKNKFADVDRTVEYDALLQSWIEARDDLSYAEIDQAYCQYILSIFQGDGGEAESVEGASQAAAANAGATAGADRYLADLAQTGQTVVSADATAEDIEREISALLARMNELYDIADETSAEYNEYLGAMNIQMLSSITARAALNLKLYVGLIAMVFLVVGCCGAILVGRIGDILEYIFLRDHQTGCMNRVSCDNYIQSLSKKVLPSGFCCFNLQLQNQNELNTALGRDGTDRILAQIGQTLKEVFGEQGNSFIGYNGSGQVWAFYEHSTGGSVAQEMERLNIVLRDQFSEHPVTYALGGVNAGELGKYQIRSLISESVIHRRQFVTAQVHAQAEA